MLYTETLRNIYQQAKRKGACDLFPCFNGSENVEELARLMFTPQGQEFCIGNRFPNLETFRFFKQYNPEQYGVYIDKGEITITNKSVYLIGETDATIILNDLEGFKVFLMHGAHAKIEAGGYSVTRIISDTKSSFDVTKKDEAIVL